jgi:hypothetical protein
MPIAGIKKQEALQLPVLISFDLTDCLSVKSAHPGVILLGIDVKGLVLDVVVPFFELPVYIFGFENLADAGFEYQYIIDAGDLLRFQNALEFYTPVRKMPDHR